MTDIAWGLYNNQKISPVAMENAYGHPFLLFTEQMHLTDGAWGDNSNIGADKLQQNFNAQLCLEPARIARGTILSMGINCVWTDPNAGGQKKVLPHPGYVDVFDAVAGGMYDEYIHDWITALVAYKARGVADVHALFQLEPATTNQPAALGSGANYVRAFDRMYPWFHSAGIKLGWDSMSSDWRINNSQRAFEYEPSTYDICSADAYPTDSFATHTLEWALGAFFDNAESKHPANPVLVRSVTSSGASDSEAATWFKDANATLLGVKNLLGVGWDPNNQGLDSIGSGAPLVKKAFRDIAVSWPSSLTAVPPTTVIVPDVIGMDIQAAALALDAVGLVAAGPASGTVDTQSPGFGTEVAIGSTVELTVTVVAPPFFGHDHRFVTRDGAKIGLACMTVRDAVAVAAWLNANPDVL